MLKSLRGLHIQLLIWAIIPLIVIVVGVSALGIISHQTAMRDLVAQRDGQLASVAAELLNERLLLHIRLLETLLGQEDTPSALPNFLAEFDGGLLLVGSEGDLLAATPAAGVWSSREPLIDGLLQEVATGDGVVISLPFEDVMLDKRALAFAVRAADGRVLMGVAACDHLQLPQLIGRLGTGARGVTSLVDRRGVVFYHPDTAREGLAVDDREVIDAVNRGEAGSTFHREENGEEMVVGYAPIPIADWGLLIHEPWSDALAPQMRVSEMTPLILVLTAVAALLVIYFGVRYIIRPLQVLEQEATRVAWGDFGAIEESVGGVQEIETLRQTLNQMTSQIRRYQTALQDYVAAITWAEEDERRRVARELHDETVQNLVALTHRVEMCEKAASPQELAHRLEDVRNLAAEALDSTRRLIYNLRPLYLEDLGLVPAIETLIRDSRPESQGLTVHFDVTGQPKRLSPEVEMAAFRIVQEALTNVIRHARASSAGVRLEFDEAYLVLKISDDGVGFVTPEAPQELAQEGHFGLMGIHERVLRFGGHLSVESAPGRGTTLLITLPLEVPSS